jgi:ABC-type uncharacterized transport system fused permease/ATPase subunit
MLFDNLFKKETKTNVFKYSRQGCCRVKSSLSELIVYCEAIAQYDGRTERIENLLKKDDIQVYLSQEHSYVVQYTRDKTPCRNSYIYGSVGFKGHFPGDRRLF